MSSVIDGSAASSVGLDELGEIATVSPVGEVATVSPIGMSDSAGVATAGGESDATRASSTVSETVAIINRATDAAQRDTARESPCR